MNRLLPGRNAVASFLWLTAGAVLAAIALEEFLVPNRIFDGGVTGINMILAQFLPLPLGVLIVLINLSFVVVD